MIAFVGLTREPIDLAAVAAAQRDPCRQVRRQTNRAWRELQPAVVDGGRKRLEQIVVNLLSNALRYTDTGGHVEVKVRPSAKDAILEVADTGIGIPAEDLSHVFTRFWRGEKSRSRAKGGAGIGLSIVQELVRARGRLTVESQPGARSVFRVAIPVSTRRPLHRDDRPITSPLHGRRS